MKYIPILFSPVMVQAIQEGRKTQTRRIVKDQASCKVLEYGHDWKVKEFWARCPYGQQGDILWVKETHYRFGRWVKNGQTKTGRQKWKFVPDNGFENIRFLDEKPAVVNSTKTGRGLGWYKRSSLFLPKKLARIFLQVEEVRVERLQDIGEEDAFKEGIKLSVNNKVKHNSQPGEMVSVDPFRKDDEVFYDAKNAFRSLWEFINGIGSWEQNPWVWVIVFKKIDKPENF